MTKIIINADDCGINEHVNKCIKHFIDTGKVSSTTIMANMDDFEGAKRLYDEYRDVVSFGIHLNMTQGKPLTYSQVLLDMNIAKSEDGELFFTGKFPYKRMNKHIKEAVSKELIAQVTKIFDCGIKPSHIDGHHHIHTYPSMLTITPRLLKQFKIERVRRMRNLMPFSINYVLRNLWFELIKLQNNNIRSSKYFGGLKEFFDKPIDKDMVFELMCHPGGYDPTEFSYMNNLIIPSNYQLISYNQI